MTQNDFFDLSLEEDPDSFDPLSGFDSDEDDFDAPLESGIIRVDPKEFPTMEALAETSRELEQQPASVRIATLFDNMQPSRLLLLSIMSSCQTPCSNTDLVAQIARYQENERSIFSPDTILHHLHRAGALERQTEDGERYEDLDLEPKAVLIDGVEYLEPVEAPEIFWYTTSEGAEVLAANKPAERLRSLIESEPQYWHIYEAVLRAAAGDSGATQKALSPKIDSDPALQKPRMYVPRFLDKLANAEALIWENGAWRITALGKEALDLITKA